MSLPDCQLDEPYEPDTCEMHDEPRPCQHCEERMNDWTFQESLEAR